MLKDIHSLLTRIVTNGGLTTVRDFNEAVRIHALLSGKTYGEDSCFRQIVNNETEIASAQF